MSNIANYLNKILSARYGRDVRQAIHDGIQQCYYEGKAGEIDLQARQDIEALNGEVDSLKEEDIAMKNDIEVLQNASDIVSATKTIMSHSSEGKLLIKEIGGASEQKKYSGKNLIPLPHDVYYPYTSAEVTYTYDDKTGYITANGTANSPGYDYSVLNVQARTDSSNPFYLSKGKYKFTGCPKTGSTYISVGYTATDGTYGSYGTDKGDGFEFEVTDETRPMQIQIKIKNGYTANNLVFKPMITNADIVDDSFEPYVGGIPAPNPSYPQEIKKSVINVVKTHGKNLIPYPYDDKLAQSGSITNRGITFTDNGDGSISAKGTPTDANPSVIDLCVRKYLPAGTYTVSDDASKGYVGVSIYFFSLVDGVYVNYTGEYEGLVKSIGGIPYIYTTANRSIPTPNNLYGYKKTFTIKESAYVTIQARSMTSSYTSEVDDICYPMLRRAEVTDDTWEVYKESSIVLSQPIELRGIEVTANDDYTYEKDGKYYISDTIEMIDGEYKKVQRIYSHKADKCHHYTAPRIFIGLPVNMKMYDNTIKTIYSMCNRFESVLHTGIVSTKDNTCGGQGNVYGFRSDSLGFSTIEEWETWFSENETVVDYILDTPIITSLSTADQIALNSLDTFGGITYLKFDSEIEPTFSGEYGTNKVGGYTLESLLLARNNDIRISSVEASIVNNI